MLALLRFHMLRGPLAAVRAPPLPPSLVRLSLPPLQAPAAAPAILASTLTAGATLADVDLVEPSSSISIGDHEFDVASGSRVVALASSDREERQAAARGRKRYLATARKGVRTNGHTAESVVEEGDQEAVVTQLRAVVIRIGELYHPTLAVESLRGSVELRSAKR